MAGALLNSLRLARAGFVLAQHGIRFVPRGVPVPLPLKIARALTVPIQIVTAPFRRDVPRASRVASALGELGPSYVKLGQFLATRADVEEELQRLSAHVAAARDILAERGSVGRKLDFLAQEFNREANTLCSKANAVDITRLGLQLKTVIDQFREQVQNVE